MIVQNFRISDDGGSQMRHFLLAIAVALSAAASFGATAETLLERGAYLMKGVVACGNCHTAPGGPFKGKELADGFSMSCERKTVSVNG